jgi:hypothetical protein
METCEPPFWENPIEFLNRFSLQYIPQCKYQVWNFSVRIFALGLIVGLVGMPICGWMSVAVSILFASVIWLIIIMTTKIYFYPPKVVTVEETQLTPTVSSYDTRDVMIAREAAKEGKYEGFVNPKVVGDGIVSRIVGVEASLPNIDVSPYSGPALPDYTPPSARNPFMNVLLDEYKYNPQRPSAASVTDPVVKQTLDDYFRVQWFSDPTDVFGKNQSQRQFVTQPSTSIPNDRESYQNWLYKIPGKTCKEGGRAACLAGTDGGPVTWLNMAS